MFFLNSGTGFKLFRKESEKITYIDKSMLISAVYSYTKSVNRYICVTRPRRFGKSTAANMIAAFFDPCFAEESRSLFESLKIGEEHPGCWDWQGRMNVIRINMINLITEKTNSYEDFINALCRNLLKDLAAAYPHLQLSPDLPVSSMLQETGDEFAFVIDEWDTLFEMPFMREIDKQNYILFLRSLLKDQSYIRFVYMTGILPVAKYSSGSPLNMFEELTAFQDEILYPFFGLTKDEIEKLKAGKGFAVPSMEELSFWYDGYIRRSDHEHIYNPNSVSKALAAGVCRSYWTGTGPMNEVRDMIQHNVKDLREDIIRMAGGETLEIELSGFSVEKTQVSTKDEILSAMVVYGFLTYHDGMLTIPNHELALKFREALASEPLGLKQTLDDSKALVNATLKRDHQEIAKRLEELHDEKIPFFQYSDENSLACVVVMGYYAALDQYRIQREDKAGKGYVDFTFTPMNAKDLPIILELKYNRSAENALECIHEREYIRRFKDYPQVLLVGINYSTATKKHTCLTELAGNSR